MFKKTSYLNWLDIIILTLILFGEAIYTSTVYYLANQGAPSVDFSTITDAQNYQMMVTQGMSLLWAFLYLLIRRFDFSLWKFQFDLESTALAVGLYSVLSLCMDLLYVALDPSFREYVLAGSLNLAESWKLFVSSFTPSLVIYSLLNGFYEEIYFIGMCCAVQKKNQPLVFIFSLVVRIAFHTYQGLLPALGIGLILGFIYYFWYQKKSRNLYPIVLSHAFADILGLSILRFILF